MAIDTTQVASDTNTTTEEIKPTLENAPADVQLSKTDTKTLEKLKALGLYSDEEIARLEAGMKIAKVQSAEAKGARGPREMATTFSPVAANVFRARLIDDMNVDDIKNKFGTDVSDTNSKVREVALKLVIVGLKEGTIAKDWVEGKLGSLNTGKERERKAKDAVVGGEAAASGAAAPTAPEGPAPVDATATATETEPSENEANPFDSSALDEIESAE